MDSMILFNWTCFVQKTMIKDDLDQWKLTYRTPALLCVKNNKNKKNNVNIFKRYCSQPN